MQDLDDIFKDRLNEEATFPNRAKQWKHLSQRLDAFEAGGGSSPNNTGSRLSWWKIATLISLAATCYFAWKGYRQKTEIDQLKSEIARLQFQEHATAPEPSQIVSTPQETTCNQLADLSSNATPEIVYSKGVKKELFDSILPKSTHKSKSNKSPIQQTKQQKTAAATANEPIANLPEIPQPAADKQVVDEPFTATNNSGNTDTVQNTRTLTLVDSLQKAILALKDSLLAEQEKPLVAAEIKPVVKPAGKLFRIGAHATLGFVQPGQKGVSPLRGQGASFEAKVWKSIWASLTADWLNHDVSTTEFIPKFHSHHDTIPKPPSGGGGGGSGPFHAKLVLVESAVRQQHVGIGIRYNLPVRFWIQPALRVAHEWVHISPSLVTYKFQEDDPGGPGPNPHPEEDRYTAEKFPGKWLSNRWRMGLGLEKELPNWTFGLWTDYSRDFSAATPSFNALYLRASAQYRF